jgi:hypothetical protein
MNPETGTTAYYFDADATNCGNSSAGDLASLRHYTTAITCFWYDHLHRLTNKTHPGGSQTDDQNFTWDSATVDGVQVGQGGTIAEAWTCPPGGTNKCSTKKTDEGFTYDSRGNISALWQTSPNSGGWYTVGESRDAIGNLNALSLPVLGTFSIPSNAYDAEGRPTAFADPEGAKLVNTVTYGVNGPLSYNDVDDNSYSFSYNSLGSMKMYKVTSDKVYSGTLSWNQNGSLGSLTIADTMVNGGKRRRYQI